MIAKIAVIESSMSSATNHGSDGSLPKRLSVEFLLLPPRQSHPVPAPASNWIVDKDGLVTRILLALGLAMFCLIAALDGHATPVQPDIRRVLAEPHASPQPFPLARAGWNGPETSPGRAAPNPILETFGLAAQRRELERGLMAAAIPDPRAVAAILTAILVLRRVRYHRPSPHITQEREAEPIAA